jgi:hypothetical protein
LVWSYWKNNRSPDFVRWFEKEIYGADSNLGDVDGDFSEQERAAHSQLNTRR